MRLEIINLIIGALGCAGALYSIWYTHHCNRRRIYISGELFHVDERNVNPPIAWFEIKNLSPSIVTLLDFKFFNDDGIEIQPINRKPVQTYTNFDNGLSSYQIPDILSDLDYPEKLNPGTPLIPYSSLEFGYQFDKAYPSITIKVTCVETIHKLRKHQSFLCYFPQDID